MTTKNIHQIIGQLEGVNGMLALFEKELSETINVQGVVGIIEETIEFLTNFAAERDAYRNALASKLRPLISLEQELRQLNDSSERKLPSELDKMALDEADQIARERLCLIP